MIIMMVERSEKSSTENVWKSIHVKSEFTCKGADEGSYASYALWYWILMSEDRCRIWGVFDWSTYGTYASDSLKPSPLTPLLWCYSHMLLIGALMWDTKCQSGALVRRWLLGIMAFSILPQLQYIFLLALVRFESHHHQYCLEQCT